jgi:uncharacterized membrane protein
MALSSYHIFYSQEARAYELLTFLAILSFYFLLKLIDKDSRKNLAAYFISTLLLLYTHAFSLLLIPVQFAYYLRRVKNKKKRFTFFKALAGIGVLFFPWIFLTYSSLVNFYSDFWVGRIDSLNLIYSAYTWTNGSYLWFGGFIASTIVLLLFILQSIRSYRDSKHMMLLAWLFFPVIVSVGYSLLVKPVVIPRYLIFCSVPFFIIASKGLDRVKSRREVFLAGLIFILMLGSVFISGSQQDKFSWSEVSDYIGRNRADGQPVLISPGQSVLTLSYYYVPECFSLEVYDCMREKGFFALWNDNDLENVPLDEELVYLRLEHRTTTQKDSFETLDEEYDVVASKNFTRMENEGFVRVFFMKKT